MSCPLTGFRSSAWPTAPGGAGSSHTASLASLVPQTALALQVGGEKRGNGCVQLYHGVQVGDVHLVYRVAWFVIPEVIVVLRVADHQDRGEADILEMLVVRVVPALVAEGYREGRPDLLRGAEDSFVDRDGPFAAHHFQVEISFLVADHVAVDVADDRLLAILLAHLVHGVPQRRRADDYFIRDRYGDTKAKSFCDSLGTDLRAACLQETEEYSASLQSPLERRETPS